MSVQLFEKNIYEEKIIVIRNKNMIDPLKNIEFKRKIIDEITMNISQDHTLLNSLLILVMTKKMSMKILY